MMSWYGLRINQERSLLKVHMWLQRLVKKRIIGEYFNTGAQRKFWLRLWNKKTLTKIKTFAWRACEDILPTKANLAKHCIIDKIIYDFYAVETEDGMHSPNLLCIGCVGIVFLA